MQGRACLLAHRQARRTEESAHEYQARRLVHVGMGSGASGVVHAGRPCARVCMHVGKARSGWCMRIRGALADIWVEYMGRHMSA